MGRISPSAMASPVSRRERWWYAGLKSVRLLWWKTKRVLGPLQRVYARNFAVSTVPAADVLANPHKERLRKTIWFLSCVPLIYYTLRDLNAAITEYNQHPVMYTFEYQTNNTLIFPDVTICNANLFLKSKFCNKSGPAWEKMDAGDTRQGQTGGDIDEKDKSSASPFCSDSASNKALCEYYCGDSEAIPANMNRAAARLSQWMKRMIAMGTSTQQLLYGMGHSIKNTVDACSYATNVSCGNHETVEDFFNLDLDETYGSCFCFHCVQKQDPGFYVYGTLSSPLSGLVLTLNTELEEYLNHVREVGFVVLIHEHGKKYSLGSDAIFVPSGYTTFIGLEMSQSTNLEKPYENPCIRDWPERFMLEDTVLDEGIQKTSYRREDCLSYCLVSLTISRCACIPMDEMSVKINRRKAEDYKPCSQFKAECSTQVKNEYSRYKLQEECGCLQECVLKSYRTDVSIAGFVPRVTAVKRSGKLEATMSQARLVVYYHSFTYEHVRAIPKYTSVRVLSVIGAINGMYMGLSFYILFQALDIFVFSTYDYILKQRRLMSEHAKTRSAAVQVHSADLRSPRNQVPTRLAQSPPAGYNSGRESSYPPETRNSTNEIGKPLSRQSVVTSQHDKEKQFRTPYGPFTISF